MPASDHYRALARRPMSLSAMITSEREQWELPVRIMDLGLGGARLELEGKLDLHAPVRLTMVSPSLWDPLVVHGQVAWTRLPVGESAVGESAAGESAAGESADGEAAEVGIRFAHTSGATLRALADLIASHAFD